MRRKIALYIADQLVDLDDQSFILFNYTMEDLSNPTIVRNSFSKQVTLPGTPNNNKIFGDIFRLDRVTQYGDGYIGGEFDPTRKTPFTVYNEMNEVIESGYIKLDNISRKGSRVEYSVTLYGGLGSFFYNLSYDSEGEKRTLADIRYQSLNGGYTKTPGSFGQYGGYSMLKDAWAYLEDPDTYEQLLSQGLVDNPWVNIINFAPAYNGLPSDFSADKAVIWSGYDSSYGYSGFDNAPNSKYYELENNLGITQQVQYGFKEGTSSNLMSFTNPHTEWEIKDLRWYLQRPIMSLRAFISAICDPENNGGYIVTLKDIDDDIALYWDGWFTLPLIRSEDRENEDAIVNLLSSSRTPAEYLISFAKIFGFIFLYDGAGKQVTLMPRKSFFSGSVIDISKRVNSELSIVPVVGDSKFYQLGGGASGEWASSYREDYGRDYGIQRINTGNDFNADVKELTSGLAFKDAVDVQERNLLYTSNALTRDEGGGKVENFILPMYEQVKLQQWGYAPDASVQDMKEMDVFCPYEWNRYFDNPDYPLSDFLPKPQFHGKDNKAEDGADVLLVFNGIKTTPAWSSSNRLEYRLTDDTEDMDILNEGVPCWNFTPVNSRKITSLPSFVRSKTEAYYEDSLILATFEWGTPLARGVNGMIDDFVEPQTIYNLWWKKYLTDRFNTDTFIMRCKVNLQGMQVGQELMRNFFFYQGAIFVLNKITNHSLTTWDDTECEFIKVQDMNNYIA